MTRNQLIVAVGLLLAATLSWGGMFPVAKPALAVISPYYLTLIRYGTAGLLFLILLRATEGPGALALEGRLVSLFVLGTVGFAGFNLLALNGLTHTPPEHGAVIMAMMPMITALLTWLAKGQRPATFTLGAIAVSFFGVFLVITGGDPARAFGGGPARWDLLFLAGAFCWVSYTMGAQRFPHWSALRYTAITSGLGSLSVAAIAISLTLAGSIKAPSLATLESLRWTFAYLIVPGALVAVLSWNTGIRRIGPVNGVLFINFVPITAFAIGALQGHAFSTAELVGAGLVIGALILNNLHLRLAGRQLARVPCAEPAPCEG
ncbi:MAG: DMT family transporter [Gammaproteobacteria bacterium]|jgi:drug/metabolite transporter (DMT)-like permease